MGARNAVLSAFQPDVHPSFELWRSSLSRAPVRVQWDPERDWQLRPIDGVRAIQIGLSGEAVERYVNEWIVGIEDVTLAARRLAADAELGIVPENLPDKLEKAYPMNSVLQRKLSDTILPKNG